MLLGTMIDGLPFKRILVGEHYSTFQTLFWNFLNTIFCRRRARSRIFLILYNVLFQTHCIQYITQNLRVKDLPKSNKNTKLEKNEY